MDSVHFYDNNFFVKEDHARELAERLMPLGIRWWCEARVDALMRYSDDTWRLLKRAGLTMIFYLPYARGESGEFRFGKMLPVFGESEVNAWNQG